MNDTWSQKELEQMYKEKTRPFCECRTPGLEMYIAKIGDKYIVKRMPNSGGLHDPTCDSYEPPAELSGLGGVLGSAIKENAENGLTELKFDFSLSKMTRKKAVTPGDGVSDTVKSDGSKLTLRSFLHYLWDQAGFCKWSPAMEGKRKWGVIQRHLYSAAANKMVKGQGLIERMFIPETFVLEKKDVLQQQWLALTSNLAGKESGAQQMMIIIGEVKEIAKARYGYKAVVKHMSYTSLMMGDDIYKRLHKRFSVELSLSNASEGSHLIIIGTASVNMSGIASLEEAALMVVTENWIPYENVFEKSLLDKLTSAGRRYIKGLRYNLSPTKPLASVVLPETTPPTAMYIIPSDAGEEYVEELDSLVEESQLATWIWDPKQTEMPEIQ